MVRLRVVRLEANGFSTIAVENLEFWECVYDPSQQVVRFAEYETYEWVLLRNNEHDYLLIEIGPNKEKWNTFFANDPRKVLEHLKEQISKESWQPLLPLIREAHKAAHPAQNEEPNLN